MQLRKPPAGTQLSSGSFRTRLMSTTSVVDGDDAGADAGGIAAAKLKRFSSPSQESFGSSRGTMGQQSSQNV